MYQRTLLRSKVLRPFSSPLHGITRSRISFPTKPNTSHVVRESSQSLITRRFSSNHAMITTKKGNIRPSTGNSRMDAQLQGGYRIIREDMTCAEFHDSVWGFVIYRSVEGHDAAWNSILEHIQSDIQDTLKDEQYKDLLPFHDLHVIDDKSLYGASTDEIRAHFQAWVPKNLEARLRPDTNCTISDVSYLRLVDGTPRYKYCLVVDEICQESVEHPEAREPVVKLVCRDWKCDWSPEELLQGVHPPYHDGITDCDEEDVGWMYMEPLSYMEKYELFHELCWDDLYVRPPYIWGFEDENSMVGHWRVKKDVNQEKEVSET